MTSVWPTEADHFTPWPLRHGSVLSQVLGLDIELQSWEDNAKQSCADVIGREVATGSPVVIERQYGPTDHLHPRYLTYAQRSGLPPSSGSRRSFAKSTGLPLTGSIRHRPCDPLFRVFLYVVALAGAPAGLVAPVLELAVRSSKKIMAACLSGQDSDVSYCAGLRGGPPPRRQPCPSLRC